MEKQLKAVNSTLQTLSTADFKKEFVQDSTKKTANLLFAQLLLTDRREESELWRFFDIDIFLEVVTQNFNPKQIATIYYKASSIESGLREQVRSIEEDPEAFARHYTYESDQVHNGVDMQTIRSEYIPNHEMCQLLGDLKTYEVITTKLQERIDLSLPTLDNQPIID